MFRLFLRLCEYSTAQQSHSYYVILRKLRQIDARTCEVVKQILERDGSDALKIFGLMEEMLGFGDYAVLAFVEVYLDNSQAIDVNAILDRLRKCRTEEVYCVL
jgi:hypothetical protein